MQRSELVKTTKHIYGVYKSTRKMILQKGLILIFTINALFELYVVCLFLV